MLFPFKEVLLGYVIRRIHFQFATLGDFTLVFWLPVQSLRLAAYSLNTRCFPDKKTFLEDHRIDKSRWNHILIFASTSNTKLTTTDVSTTYIILNPHFIHQSRDLQYIYVSTAKDDTHILNSTRQGILVIEL